MNLPNASGETPLHDAALHGKASAVAVPLDHGTDIDAREIEFDTTALYAAASLGHEEVTATLSAEGADPNICSKKGASALHAELAGGYQSIADRIRASGGRGLPQTARPFRFCFSSTCLSETW